MKISLDVEKPQVYELNISGSTSINIGVDMEINIGRTPYSGTYTVVPLAHSPVILHTKNFRMLDDVTVTKIPYWETSNPNGKTVYIAEDINDGN